MDDCPLLDALELPAAARLDKRVPKKLLTERGAPTAADRRKIQDGIEELRWVASLKPRNCGVPAHRSPQHDYSEIAILRVVFRDAAKVPRLAELTHRAIPYPVVLVAEQGGQSRLSLAPKRRSGAEIDKFVLETSESTGLLDFSSPPPLLCAFLERLPVSRLPPGDLRALYLGWVECVVSLHASEVTGSYRQAEGRATAVREALDAHQELAETVAKLRRELKAERQLPRQVELNLQIKRLEAEALSLKNQL